MKSRAIVQTGVRALELREFPLPEIGDEEIDATVDAVARTATSIRIVDPSAAGCSIDTSGRTSTGAGRTSSRSASVPSTRDSG